MDFANRAVCVIVSWTPCNFDQKQIETNMSYFLKKLLLISLAMFIGGFIVFAAVFGGTAWSIFAISSAASDEGGSYIASKTVLKIKLNGDIAELGNDPFDGLDLDIPGAAGFTGSKMGLFDIIQSIDAAATDEKIEGIYLSISGVSAGFAQLEEIRSALLRFKASKKFIISYSDMLTEGGYFIASVADDIVLHQEGFIEFNGLSSQRMYYKGMFDKVGIEPKVFKVGKYKSAVEPYLYKKMSPEAREQAKAYLDGLYDHYLEKVAASRSISFDSLKMISSQMLVQTPDDAEAKGLVTKLGYFDDVLSMLREKTEAESNKDLKFISLADYIDSRESTSNISANRIAVIVAEGVISDVGDDSEMVIGQKMAAQIRKAREDDKIKAIVLRINSPGGSKIASDVIWREVVKTKDAGKPIIASMSDVAASGGYYIAMGCDKIYAQPNTITGSIGIYGLMLNMEELFEKNLGITFDRVNTGEYSALGDPMKEMNATEKAFFDRMVKEGYQDFVNKAAEGRNMHPDSVHLIAQGRVWTGKDAEKIGLVDELGSFQDALDQAAIMAGLEKDDYKVRYYPQQKDFFEKLLGGNTKVQVTEDAMKQELGQMYSIYKELKSLQYHTGIQARMPTETIIR